MAIISTETICITGQQFKRKIKVDSSGKFSIDLPSIFTDAFGIKQVRGDSLGEVKGKFGDLYEKFCNAKTSTRRVIAYQCQAECSEDLKCEGISFLNGMGLAVSAVLLEETTTETAGGEKTYSYETVDIDENADDYNDEDYEYKDFPLGRSIYDRSIYPHMADSQQPENIMEWTQEREDFFKELGAAMKTLILRCDEIMAGNITIQAFIEGNQKLLGNLND